MAFFLKKCESNKIVKNVPKMMDFGVSFKLAPAIFMITQGLSLSFSPPKTVCPKFFYWLGSLCVCQCVCHCVPKNYEGSQRLKCQIFPDIVSDWDISTYLEGAGRDFWVWLLDYKICLTLNLHLNLNWTWTWTWIRIFFLDFLHLFFWVWLLDIQCRTLGLSHIQRCTRVWHI